MKSYYHRTILPALLRLARAAGLVKKAAILFWNKNLKNKILVSFCIVLALLMSGMYGIGEWYIQKHKKEPLTFGATFIPSYARDLGVDPQETMQAMIDDLGIKRFRLVSYWNVIELVQGTYDFSELDWQFKKAESAGATVSLALGLRQPRWPECHIPSWAKSQQISEWYPNLRKVITTTIERYKNSPALQSYQLENEYFLDVFGNCPDHSAWRLKEEYELVKSLDSSKPLTMSRSNNAVPSWPVSDPKSDINAASIYKRLWDKTFTKRYFEYPIPPWYYAFLAGGAELTTGKNTFIHELQTEPWLPEGFSLKTAPTSEMYKSMNPTLLAQRMQYAVDTGMRTIDLWGPEWWYFMKTIKNDPGMWNTAKAQLKQYNDCSN